VDSLEEGQCESPGVAMSILSLPLQYTYSTYDKIPDVRTKNSFSYSFGMSRLQLYTLLVLSHYVVSDVVDTIPYIHTQNLIQIRNTMDTKAWTSSAVDRTNTPDWIQFCGCQTLAKISFCP
jgi:hypothetical protein